jgi:asparagine synthase (glutamine-hydrolysing)
MDVPILDPACIPLYALLKKISIKSNCVLTGDGGDELTQGYELFKYLLYIKGINKLPRIVRLSLSNLLNQLKMFNHDDYKGIQFKIDRFSDVLLDDSSNFTAALSPFAGTSLYKTLIQSRPRENTFKEKISNQNLELYYLEKILPNIYLRKADRMGMANGIELRAPFLDYEAVKTSMNFSDKELRKMGRKGPISYLASQHLPEAIANQDKHGFSFRFNSMKKYLSTPLWDLQEIGFSKDVCNDLWNNTSNSYNYSLASWALYVLNHFKNENRLEFK